MKTAYATIKDFEVIRIFKKGKFNIWMREENIKGGIRLINDNFGIYTV